VYTQLESCTLQGSWRRRKLQDSQSIHDPPWQLLDGLHTVAYPERVLNVC